MYGGAPYYCATTTAGVAGTVGGTALSPASTYDGNNNMTGQGGYGLDAGMAAPYDLAPDASGNLWVTDMSNNRLLVFFGLTAPTATPRVPVPAAP
jgi:streptogramin lyase